MSWFTALLAHLESKRAPQVERSVVEQQRVDRLANSLTLYVVPSCTLCLRIRRHLKNLNVSVTVKDLKRCHIYEKELFAGGG